MQTTELRGTRKISRHKVLKSERFSLRLPCVGMRLQLEYGERHLRHCSAKTSIINAMKVLTHQTAGKSKARRGPFGRGTLADLDEHYTEPVSPSV